MARSLGFGLGLRPAHYTQIVESRPRVGWFEILSENYMQTAGRPLEWLDAIAGYRREWEAFVHAVQSGTAPPVTTRDARAPLVIGLAAWRSLREDRPVRLEEVDGP